MLKEDHSFGGFLFPVASLKYTLIYPVIRLSKNLKTFQYHPTIINRIINRTKRISELAKVKHTKLFSGFEETARIKRKTETTWMYFKFIIV